MSNPLFAGTLCACLLLPSAALGHGGGFPGPPPVPPPGETNPNPPPPPPPPPPTSGPASPGAGGGPSTPGDTTPKAPAGGTGAKTPGTKAAPPPPGRPRTGGVGSPGAPRGSPSAPRAPQADTSGANAEDWTHWQYWWAFNQAPYLRLKSHIHAASGVTGTPYKLGDQPTDTLRDALRVSPAQIRGVIVPRLLAALRQESSDDIQSSCMIALGKIGDPGGKSEGSALALEVQREIQKRLVSPSQELSETAAVSLGISGNREHIPVLTAVLENDLPALRKLEVPQRDDVTVRTRAFAAYGLGLIGHRAGEYDRLVINATLRKLLDGDGRNMALRDVPVACVTSIGLTPLPIDEQELLRAGSKEPKDPGSMSSRQDQLRFLLAYYADESIPSLTRAQAPTAMARLLSGPEVPDHFEFRAMVAKALMQSIAEGSKDTNAMQQSCILALGVIGDCDADTLDQSIRTALMRVKDRIADQQARRFALIALAHAAGQPGSGIGDPLHGVNTRDSEENARTFLLRELSNDRGPSRPWLGLSIAIMERSLEDAKQASSSDSRHALRTSLADSRAPESVGAFAIACGLARDRDSKDVLLAKLDSVRDVEARGHTAVALGLLNEQSAIAPITEIAKQSKYQAELLRSAATALGLLGDKQAVPDLIEMLSSAASLSSQAAICMSLGTIGDSRSVPALLELLGNTKVTELARAFGAVALGIVADKEDLPWNAKIGVGSNYRANTPSLTDGKGGILDIL